MTTFRIVKPCRQPAFARLASLTPLGREEEAQIERGAERARIFRAHEDLLAEGAEIAEPMLILHGWAARIRILEDGRRQILGLLLPGDVIGLYGHDRALATSTFAAITEVQVCEPPEWRSGATLAQAYAVSRAHEEAQLLAQIARIGRMNAQERIVDLLLELLGRLEDAGLAQDGRTIIPLTQEMIADILGLTPVHVNRTIQLLRRHGELNWKGREVVLADPTQLRRSVGHVTLSVAAPRVAPRSTG